MRLSSLIKPHEADVFRELATRLRGSNALRSPTCVSDSQLLDIIEKAVRDALGYTDVRVQFKGSKAKGTETRSSDIDIDIETPGRCVERADKQVFADHLRKLPPFHKSHVILKRLAIGCIVGGAEVDLVFAQSVLREEPDWPDCLGDQLNGNPAAQNAARALKVALRCSAGPEVVEKLPSFVIELLVTHTSNTHADCVLSHRVKESDGSMQLFCDTLQRIADNPDVALRQFCNHCHEYMYCSSCQWLTPPASGRVCKEIGGKKRDSVHVHICKLLHNFCASRFYSPDFQGFNTLCKMERWIRNIGSSAMLPTPMGDVPSWLIGFVDEDDSLITFMHDDRANTGSVHRSEP